ncbi:MAG TPA: efflux RND transporter periplasmic adaptor subunit [Vicinamibacterales bacterium]|nr:efflux RND transporter periplasmic adaptor subunit [Vicinamibacterales bacterium]
MSRVVSLPVPLKVVSVAAGLLAAVIAGCSRPSQAPGAGGPPGGAFPPMAVDVVPLAVKQVEQTSEFIGTVKSRRSATVQPQVEGFVTRIAARSGDRVRAGAVLMEIDAGRQQAAVGTLEAQRAARDADLAYWKQQAARLATLLQAGAVSQQEFDQADAQRRAGEAQLAAVDQQIREQRVELGYYRVLAPAAGVVGDIPVRVGDRVTRSTVLTTVDDNQGLEIYIQVPVQQAPDLSVGLPVRLVDDRGATLVETTVTFVAPSVDPATQSVLAKAALDRPGALRNDQFVRARIVWRAVDALTAPLVAMTRINGRFFAFVAEGSGDKTVARQRPVELGELTGNDYVVLKGLAAGERLIVTGVQKIGDGAPVAPSDVSGPTGAAK